MTTDTRTSFEPATQALFFTRNDASDPRLGEIAKPVTVDSIAKSKDSNSFVIAGYPDDEGIKINGGRVGASAAPNTIRKYLYKTTPSYLAASGPTAILDVGNLKLDVELAERHKLVRKTATQAYLHGYRWLGLGGGHDYGYADSAAFCEVFSKEQKPLVINFDAHLDVRSTEKGLSSGTPFFRLLSEFDSIDFVELGVQGQCNSQNHVSWLKERGGKILSMEEIRASGESFSVCTLKFLESLIAKRRPAFLSIDIDAFSSSEAPGCSQSWATGFRADEFFSMFQVLLKRLDIKGIAIYEVSPPLDQDDRTSKLAALIAHRFLYQL